MCLGQLVLDESSRFIRFLRFSELFGLRILEVGALGDNGDRCSSNPEATQGYTLPGEKSVSVPSRSENQNGELGKISFRFDHLFGLISSMEMNVGSW